MTMIEKMKCFFGTVLISLFALLFTTCESGLGEAVDTLAPMVTITGPESSAILSGPFEITGTCVDDKMVAKVLVTVTKTDSGEEVGMYAAESEIDTWKLKLNELKDGAYPIKDGSYSVDVVCFDTAGRKSGVASRVFDVDNTAPVFCLTKPNSLNISDPAAYGRDVVIRGEIADDHPIRQMDIRVFKWQDGAATEITGSLAKTTFSGFETAGGSEIPIAKFYPDSEIPESGTDNYALYQNYKAMYTDLGAQVGDTVSLFVFPYLTDVAGNKSDKCYIQSALKQLVSKACNVDTTSDSLQTAQLKKIVNGSYNLGELSVETMKQILNGQYDQSSSGANYLYYASLPLGANPDAASTAMLAMSLNANNSPMYEFGGYSVDRSALSFSEIASEGQFSVKVAAGLDGNEIVTNTVRVYLWECSDTLKLNKGLDINDVSTASLSSDNADPAKKVTVTTTILENGQIKEVETKDLGAEHTSSNATLKVNLPQMAAGTHYILKADGKDTAGNRFYSGVDYALMIATTGDSPRVEFADQFFVNAKALAKPADSSQAAPYSAKIQITDKSGEDKMGTLRNADNWVKATVSLYKGCAKSKANLADLQLFETLDELTFEGAAIKSDSAGEYYIEIPLNKFDLQAYDAPNYTIALQVQAKNTGAWSEATTYIFWADKTPPVLEAKAPARKSADGSYYICRETDGSEIHVATETVTDPQSGETTTTTKYEYTPRGSWSDESGSGTSELWYALTDTHADGSPAAPAIAPVWTACADDERAVADKTYYAKQGDGIYAAQTTVAANESVKGLYKLSPGSGWTAISGAPKSASRANWNQSIADISNSSGKTLSLVAVDQTGNFSAVAAIDNIMFDLAPPAVTLPEAKAYYTDSDKEKDGDNVGKYVFTILASDLSGIKSLDIAAKRWREIQPASDSQPAVYGYAPVAQGEYGYALAVSSDKTKATVTLLPATSDGKWLLEAAAQDMAERDVSQSLSFVIDNAAPVRTEHYVDSQNPDNKRMLTISLGSRKGAHTEWYNSENLAIKGKFLEETSGLARVEYTVTAPLKQGQTEADKQSGSEAQAGSSGAVEYTISPLGFAEGVNTIEIKGVDKAGNASGSESYPINIDATSPLVGASWYTYDGTNLIEASGTALTNGSVPMTVYGTLEDTASGIKTVELWVGKPDANKKAAASSEKQDGQGQAAQEPAILLTKASGLNQGADDAEKKATFTGATWLSYDSGELADKTAITGFKAVIPAAALGAAESGDAELYAVVEDMAGNRTEQRKFLIHLDKEAPVTTVRSPVAGSVVNGKVTFAGTTSDPALSSVSAYWKWKDEADETKWAAIPLLTGTFNWKIEDFELSKVIGNVDATTGVNSGSIAFVDGTAYNGSPKTIQIKIAAADKAGNVSYKIAEYEINPDKDRPTITLTTADLAGMSSSACVPHAFKRLEGSVEDDDGVKKLECWRSKYVYDDATQAWKWDDWGNYEEVTVKDGSWTYPQKDDAKPNEGALDDGKFRFKFKVTDKADSVFTSTTAGADGNINLSPKIAGTNSSVGPVGPDGRDVDTHFYLSVDTNPPNHDPISYSVWDPDQGKYVAEETPTELKTVGGLRKKIKLNFDAKDENGITKVLLTLNKTEYIGSVGAISGGKYPCEIEGIDVSLLATKNYSATLKIVGSYDGDSSSEEIAIDVDNTKPVVGFLKPDSAKTVNGSIETEGTVDGAAKVQFALSRSNDPATAERHYEDELDDTDAQGNPIKKPNYYGGTVRGAGASSWRVLFDNEGSTEQQSHAKSLQNFIIDQKITQKNEAGKDVTATEASINSTNQEEVFDTVVPIYLWIKATDEVGNVSEEVHLIQFDPQGDRPNLYFQTLPNYQNRIGGKFKVSGTAEGEGGVSVKGVFFQFVWNEEHYLNANSTPKYEGGRGGADGAGWGSVERDDSTRQVTKVTPTKNTWDYMAAAGYTIVNMKGAKDSSGKYLGFDPANLVTWVSSGSNANTDDDAPDFAILADYKESGAWNLTINEYKELNVAPGIVKYNKIEDLPPEEGRAYMDMYGRAIKDITYYEKTTDASGNDIYTVKTVEVGVTDVWGLYIKENVNTSNVCLCARATNGAKFSQPIYKQIVVDPDNPEIDNIKLRRYKTVGGVETKEVEYSKSYTSGVFVKGNIRLEFDLRDNDDICKIYIGKGDDEKAAYNNAFYQKGEDQSGDEVKNWTSTAAETIAEDLNYPDPSFRNYNVSLSLDTGSGVGCKYLYILFSDIKGNYNYKDFAIYYDNRAPEIVSKTIESPVCNSNNFYSIEANVEERADSGKNQSGFDRFIVCFTRTITENGATKTYLYDPMIDKKKKNNNRAEVSAANNLALGEDGVYWKKVTVERDEDNLNVITLPQKDPHIHVGRIVKMDGVLYKIARDGVNVRADGKKVDVTLNDYVDSKVTTAYFAYGISIDNASVNEKEKGDLSDGDEDGWGYHYYSIITSDDGDDMLESVDKNGTTYSLEGAINSRNIPDGKIDIHYTAFDKAGNFTTGVVNGKVENNSPRLANVTVMSDFDFDGNYTSDGESRARFDKMANGADWEVGKTKWQDAHKSLDLGSAGEPWLAAKGDVLVKPEILGGNGALTWTWTYPTDSGRADGVTHKDQSGAEKKSQELYAAIEEEQAIRKDGGTLKDITLLGSEFNKAKAGDGKYIIKILDETEGGAQEALVNLYLRNDVHDAESPVAKTKRFYWNGLNDNSVYDSSSAQKPLDLKGHIEFEDAARFGDERPKVSGKIVLKGTAFDNAGIKQLKLTIPGILDTPTTVAECKFADENGAPLPVGSRWALQSEATGSGYSFSIDSDRYTNTGHFVSWTLVYDTQESDFGGYSAKKDVNFVLGIVDKNGNVSSGATNDAMIVYATTAQAAAGKYYAEKRFAQGDSAAGYPKADYAADEFKSVTLEGSDDGVNYYSATPVDANYNIDIVPYIQKATTSLSAIGSSNGLADRSSLGRYPIYNYKNSTSTGVVEGDKELVTINGFNLKGAKYGSVALNAPANSSATLSSDRIASGPFELTVNGVKTLNNVNDNDSKGTYSQTTSAAGGDFEVYKNYINRQPNNENNNNLTDDIAFDVWQLNNKAAAPMYGKVEDPQMKINPQNGKIGFAFANSSAAFTMPNTAYSWTYWNYGYTGIRHTSLAYEPSGYVWAAAAGQDVNGDNGDSFYLESNHWREQGGRWNNGNFVMHKFQDTTIYAACKLERLSVKVDGNIKNQLDRIQSPSMAATKNGLYMAYYDKITQQIRYKAGKLTGAFNTDFTTGTRTTTNVWRPDSGNWNYWEFKNGFFKDEAYNSPNPDYSDANVQLVGNSVNPIVSIAAISGPSMENDIVVMVWNEGGQIKYARTVGDPMAKTGAGRLSATWKASYYGSTEPRTLFSGKISDKEALCKVAVDAEGGVHIAACNSDNLYYAYMETPNSEPVEAVVDSYNNTGDYLTIDVALAPGSSAANPKPIPQIGFYSAYSSRPKYARWNPNAGNLRTAASIDGCDANGAYTGNWEVTNVPTTNFVITSVPSKVRQNINVGVWKDEDGILTVSTTGRSFCKTGYTDDNLNADNYGDVYGNGTANAVLSYMYGSTSEGFIETAQRIGEY